MPKAAFFYTVHCPRRVDYSEHLRWFVSFKSGAAVIECFISCSIKVWNKRQYVCMQNFGIFDLSLYSVLCRRMPPSGNSQKFNGVPYDVYCLYIFSLTHGIRVQEARIRLLILGLQEFPSAHRRPASTTTPTQTPTTPGTDSQGNMWYTCKTRNII